MNPTPKIIFFDIDGTLISNNTQYITPELLSAFRTLREKGIKLCISSGRHISTVHVLGVDKDFTFDSYITLNGNTCFAEGELLFSNPVCPEDVAAAIDFTEKKHLPCAIMEREGIYLNFIDETVKIVFESIHTPPPDVKDIREGLHTDVYQVIPITADKRVVEEMLAGMPHCKVTSWHPFAYDIVDKNGGKARGIEEILRFYGIDISETMAFGDGDNDIEMLQYVAHPIAMGNAEPAVKMCAEYVTSSVDEGGIVAALRHYGLL